MSAPSKPTPQTFVSFAEMIRSVSAMGYESPYSIRELEACHQRELAEARAETWREAAKIAKQESHPETTPLAHDRRFKVCNMLAEEFERRAKEGK